MRFSIFLVIFSMARSYNPHAKKPSQYAPFPSSCFQLTYNLLLKTIAMSLIVAKTSTKKGEADVARPEQVEALFEHIRTKHERLDILVNCVAHRPKNDLMAISLEEWNEILAVNLTSYFLCIQQAAKIMKEHRGGTIINISAASGERGMPGAAAYSVSKGAVNALTRQAAVDLAPYNIRVNCIISGTVGTPVGRRDMGSRKPTSDIIPLGRIGNPLEVAEAVAFLASEKASYITNAILPVDGGRMNATGSASGG